MVQVLARSFCSVFRGFYSNTVPRPSIESQTIILAHKCNVRPRNLTSRSDFEFCARQCFSKLVPTRCHPLAADMIVAQVSLRCLRPHIISQYRILKASRPLRLSIDLQLRRRLAQRVEGAIHTVCQHVQEDHNRIKLRSSRFPVQKSYITSRRLSKFWPHLYIFPRKIYTEQSRSQVYPWLSCVIRSMHIRIPRITTQASAHLPSM